MATGVFEWHLANVMDIGDYVFLINRHSAVLPGSLL